MDRRMNHELKGRTMEITEAEEQIENRLKKITLSLIIPM